MSQLRRRAVHDAADAIDHTSSRQSDRSSAPMEGDLPPVKRQGSRSSKIDDLSLAGPQGLPRRFEPHNNWYDEDYLDVNPWMTQQNESPEFSLAGNFPRTVRWRPKDRKDQPGTVQPDTKGESEAAPQVASAEEQGEAASLGEDYDATDFAQDPAEEESIKRRKREGRLKPQRSTNSAATTHSLANARKYQDQDFPDITNPTNGPFNPWSVVRLKYGRPMGEFLGMTVFIFLGISCNLSITVSQNQAGNLNTEYFCWGFAAMLGIYISGGSSGAFLNPVLVIMLSVFRGFPAKRLPSYIFAQCLGAFVGTLLALAVYHDSIIHMDGALLPETTGLSIYTQPRGPYIRASTAFFTELLGSAILCCTILALGDSGNSPPGAGMHALIIGLLITTCTMALSWTTRGCFNPARDFGPRLAAIAFGYPLDSFTAWHNWWIWGGWVAPITGGLIGGLAYDLCVFKGGESPVNFSWGAWKKRGLRKEQLLLWNVFGKRRKAEAIGRKLESGSLGTKEERNSGQA